MSFLRRLFGSDEPARDPAQPPAPSGADAGDRMVIDRLRQAGADLSRPREVIHYLYLPTQEAATAAADRLRNAGYTTEVRPAAGPPGPNPWLALATIEQVVDSENIGAARALFTALAGDANGEYDGWEAAAEP